MNREEVIKGVECCFDCDYLDGNCSVCAYKDDPSCADKLKADIIALLKAQEPVKPKREIRGCGFRWFCGECGINIEPNHMYCRICGRAVKWND